MTRSTRFSLASALAAFLVGPGVRAAPTYKITDLGTLGGVGSRAHAVNDQGDVAGVAEKPDGIERAFLWTRPGGMIDLGTLGGQQSAANAINNHGEIVGTAQTASGQWHAFLWRPRGGMLDLGSLDGNWSQALDINDRGDVLVRSSAADGSIHAVRWTQGSGFTDLGNLGGMETYAFGINNSGQMVGLAVTGAGKVVPVSWQQGGLQPMDLPAGSQRGTAWNLNDRGQIVGEVDGIPFIQDHGDWQFLRSVLQWTQLPGSARAINRSGDVVGNMVFEHAPGQIRAFLYSNGTLYDLNQFLPPDSGWKILQWATNINKRGAIVGFGTRESTAPSTQSLGHARAWLAETK